MTEKMYKIGEVALLIGVSEKTINFWYGWKRTNPDNDLVKFLPEYITVGQYRTRYWRDSDIWKLIKFKSNVPKGRNGIMGDVTQKSYRKKHNYQKKG